MMQDASIERAMLRGATDEMRLPDAPESHRSSKRNHGQALASDNRDARGTLQIWKLDGFCAFVQLQPATAAGQAEFKATSAVM